MRPEPRGIRHFCRPPSSIRENDNEAWSDAKFGTIANLIILLALILSYSSFNFKSKIVKEREKLFESSQSVSEKVITKETISELPSIIQKWLINNGTISKKPIYNVYLTQELQLKLKPEQTTWNYGMAEQYFTIQPPAFNWNINTEMNSILSIVGRDKFVDGKGEMVIKLLSLIPVANTKNNEKVNQATLQRYLAEIVWFPSASLNEYIKWEPIDDNSARAIMEYKGTEGSGVFHFNENGDFKKFIAMRYKDARDAEPAEWTVTASETAVRNGIRIPVQSEVKWKLDDSEWTWLKLRISDIKYNGLFTLQIARSTSGNHIKEILSAKNKLKNFFYD